MSVRIGFSTGWAEDYWKGWPWVPMYGGSEHIVVELAKQFAIQGHDVTVRLPRQQNDRLWEGILWAGAESSSRSFDLLFSFDDFAVRDSAGRVALVACRSDPPPHAQFDQLIFLSAHHAKLMGHPGRPHVGGGVNLGDYATPMTRIPRRVICCSSPDRCARAATIGRGFDFVHSYRAVQGYPTVELDRPGLTALQKTAQVMIYPLDPSRPSDFFSMAVLEAMAAGTPVIVSDADSMPELWGDTAVVLKLPIRLSEWHTVIEDLLQDTTFWARCAIDGRKKAADYAWDKQAARYLEIATA